MRRLLPALLFAAVAIAAMVLIWRDSGAHLPRVPTAPVVAPDPRAGMSDEALRERARAASDCRVALADWWALAERDADDVEPWRAIARCQGRPGTQIDSFVDETATAFGESRVLGVLPNVLEVLRLRDKVPILSDVDPPPDLAPADLLLLGQIRREVGDLRGALAAFERAVDLAPNDVEANLAFGYALVEDGDVDEARPVFRSAVSGPDAEWRLLRLYAIAVGWPHPFLAIIVGIVGFAFSLGRKDPSAPFWTTLAVTVFTVVTLGLYFEFTADRIAFGFLTGIGVLAVIYALGWPLRGPSSWLIRFVGSSVGQIATGRIHDRLQQVPSWLRVVLLVGEAVVIVVLVPLVPDIDVRLALLFLTVMLLLATIGALMLPFVERASSLRETLRWLGFAGTLPFLLFFLYVERDGLLRAAWGGSFLSRADADRLAGYLLVWAIGLACALVLSHMLARAILEPLARVMDALLRVRQGAFDVRLGLVRHDEIGALGGAVDEMAKALRDRETLATTFRRWVNPDVAERLMAGDPLVLQGQEIHATVLFADVRGFTARSEDQSPQQVIELLNAYFARIEPVIRRWGGTVDKFLGDGLLATWDVPAPKGLPGLGHVPGERLAVECAGEMLVALAAFNEELAARGQPKMEIGIGIHAGAVIAGPVGSPDRQDYTVIGDVVNTAQRVESMARDGAHVLVTAEVAERCGEGVVFAMREPVALKGKREPVVLYALERVEVSARKAHTDAGAAYERR